MHKIFYKQEHYFQLLYLLEQLENPYIYYITYFLHLKMTGNLYAYVYTNYFIVNITGLPQKDTFNSTIYTAPT